MVFDLNKAYCRYFYEISKIPHASGHEKQLSDWLVNFANTHGLSCIQDDWHNVIIYKQAATGYEEHPGILLQAHMDMVCEKEPDCTHDFDREPLELYVEGDRLRAKGTTLGADDGMGCAYMLAILADEKLRHPFLECCFTTQEEVGLVGAQQLKPEYFKARRLINLDGAGEYRTYMSMGGGRKVTLQKPAEFAADSGPAYCLTVTGLLGGHSGGMIDKERANANKLLARVLCKFAQRGIRFRLAELGGGTKPNVITPRAKAVFTATESPEVLAATVRECAEGFAEQFEFTDPDIQVELVPSNGPCRTLSEEESQGLAELVFLLPSGQIARSLELDIPLASVNLGVVRLTENGAELVESVRSALESWAGQLVEEIALLAARYGARCAVSDAYPGWKYEKQSPLRESMCRAFEEHYGKPLLCLAGHGGNECGVFKQMHPDMDIVTSGAIYGEIHTTGEYLDLASFDRAYAFLTYFLERL